LLHCKNSFESDTSLFSKSVKNVWSLGIVGKPKSASPPNIVDADKILDGQIWRNPLMENYVSPSLLYSLLNE
jgi:hypothetical protein